MPPASAARLVGRSFFPTLIAGPFHSGLVVTLGFAIVMCLIAVGASWLRGGRFVYEEHDVERRHHA